MLFVQTEMISMWGVVLRHSPGTWDGLIVPLPERFCAAIEAYILRFNGVLDVNTD